MSQPQLQPTLPGHPFPAGYRIRIEADRLWAQVGLLGTQPLRVLELSPIGVLLELPPRAPHGALGFTRVSLICSSEQIPDLPGEIIGYEPTPARDLVAIRFPALDIERGRLINRLGRYLATSDLTVPPEPRVAFKEALSDLGRIRTAVRALLNLHTKARLVSAAATGSVLRLEGTTISDESKLRWTVDGPAPGTPFTVETVGYNSVYSMTFEAALQLGQQLVTSLPDEVVRTRHRWHRRAAAATGMVIRFAHPVWPDQLIVRPVSDVSHYGCGIESDVIHDVLYPGMYIPRLTVEWAGRPVMVGSGWVRVISDERDGVSRCGVELAPARTPIMDSWQQLVDSLLHPEVSVGAPWSEDAWELFEDSGYFHLSGKDPRDFARLRRDYVRAAQKLATSPALGCIAVWPLEDGIAGSLTLLRMYPKTWMACHMAKRRGALPGSLHGGTVLRTLVYRCYEHAAKYAHLDWLLAYIQEDAGWSRVAHHDFPSRFVEDGLAYILRFRAIQISTGFRRLHSPPGVSVSSADDTEIQGAHNQILASRPEAYRDALALSPGAMDYASFTSELDRAGLDRQREFLVLRNHGLIRAYAVLESADEGVHLYGLLDVVRIFAVKAELARAELEVLLEEAARWYQEQGKSYFVLFDEDGLCDPTQSSFTIDLGNADLCLLSACRLPDLLEHVLEITTPRALLGALDPADGG